MFMGYNTNFEGKLSLDRSLDEQTKVFLNKLNKTRRVKRDVNRIAIKEDISYEEAITKYGFEGEFYFSEEQTHTKTESGIIRRVKDDTVIENNKPPSRQPSLWCQWKPTDDGKYIMWDGLDKFYEADKWIEYIIVNILEPKGYILNGRIKCIGEENPDLWYINVINNQVNVEIENRDGFFNILVKRFK